MNLIVGLGNPGKEYINTRHNVGFMVVDKFCPGCWKYSKKFKAEICHTSVEGQTIYLVKPQTFMNRSGESIRELIAFLDVPLDRLWVVHDDLDLEIGTIRVRKGGSSGGHNGVQSLINDLGSQEFPRFRLGIKTQRAESVPAERFVLEKFGVDEQAVLEEAIEKTASEIKKALKEGIDNISV